MNTIEKKKHAKQMRPRIKSKEKKPETSKINVVDVVMIRPIKNDQQWDNSADSVRRYKVLQIKRIPQS